MLDIFIDADACPVKEEALRVAERHGLTVYVVSNSWMRQAVGENVHRIVVSDGPDAADNWIAERIGKGDIAVTADIPLADRCLKAGAMAIGPSGKAFTPDNIGNALAARTLSAHLRETGVIAGNNPLFSKQDRSRFLSAMEDAIQKSKRLPSP
jgi:uncharacterized protein YaiI (UPF0178 family)